VYKHVSGRMVGVASEEDKSIQTGNTCQVKQMDYLSKLYNLASRLS
jgi:hypothetical protein